LRHPGRQTLLGIDGLYRYGNSLIAIQNGVRPQRVLRLGLNGSGEKIETIEILESSLPIFDDPTLGVIVGDALYFIANSHWPQFNAEGNLPPAERLTPPTVLRVAL
jgi:hypothetical protein